MHDFTCGEKNAREDGWFGSWSGVGRLNPTAHPCEKIESKDKNKSRNPAQSNPTKENQ
jgi:hypothetical protein